MHEQNNVISLSGLDKYVSNLNVGMKRQYDRGVNMDLSQQNPQDLFKRNMANVLRQVYADALIELQQLNFECEGNNLKESGADLIDQVLAIFEGVAEELMQYALQKHRSSCALSNFPSEHNPNQDYIVAVIQETDSAWQAFAMQVKARLTA